MDELFLIIISLIITISAIKELFTDNNKREL